MPAGAQTVHFDPAKDVLLVMQPEVHTELWGRRAPRMVLVPPPTTLAVPCTYDEDEYSRGQDVAAQLAESHDSSVWVMRVTGELERVP